MRAALFCGFCDATNRMQAQIQVGNCIEMQSKCQLTSSICCFDTIILLYIYIYIYIDQSGVNFRFLAVDKFLAFSLIFLARLSHSRKFLLIFPTSGNGNGIHCQGQVADSAGGLLTRTYGHLAAIKAGAAFVWILMGALTANCSRTAVITFVNLQHEKYGSRWKNKCESWINLYSWT